MVSEQSAEVGGCLYCGQMHPPLYICDEMRAARAKEPVHKPMAKVIHAVAKNVDTPMAKKSTTTETSTYRYRDPVKRRAYQRDLMRQRYAKASQPKA